MRTRFRIPFRFALESAFRSDLHSILCAVPICTQLCVRHSNVCTVPDYTYVTPFGLFDRCDTSFGSFDFVILGLFEWVRPVLVTPRLVHLLFVTPRRVVSHDLVRSVLLSYSVRCGTLYPVRFVIIWSHPVRCCSLYATPLGASHLEPPR